MFLGGAGTWVLVQGSLADERITVSEDAAWNAGKEVNGPFTAYSEAMVIEKHALEASGNKTYAELDREDPVRVTVMNGSFLRASLFTSVLAFGVSAMAMGLGFVQVLGGLALAKVGKDARRLRHHTDRTAPAHQSRGRSSSWGADAVGAAVRMPRHPPASVTCRASPCGRRGRGWGRPPWGSGASCRRGTSGAC